MLFQPPQQGRQGRVVIREIQVRAGQDLPLGVPNPQKATLEALA